MENDLNEAFRFFSGNAGGWVGHHAETALRLAKAEKRAEDEGFTVTWDYDPDPELGDHEYWCKDAKAGREHYHEVLYVVAKDSNGRTLASLGAIIDPDAKYRRVIEAELYQEALAEQDKREASRCPTCKQVRV